MLDRAALTLHEGFLISVLGDRAAVVAYIFISSIYPSSLSILFWVGVGLAFGWEGLAPAGFGISTFLSYLLAGILVLVGISGMWLDLRKMAKRPVVRGGG